MHWKYIKFSTQNTEDANYIYEHTIITGPFGCEIIKRLTHYYSTGQSKNILYNSHENYKFK